MLLVQVFKAHTLTLLLAVKQPAHLGSLAWIDQATGTRSSKASSLGPCSTITVIVKSKGPIFLSLMEWGFPDFNTVPLPQLMNAAALRNPGEYNMELPLTIKMTMRVATAALSQVTLEGLDYFLELARV